MTTPLYWASGEELQTVESLCCPDFMEQKQACREALNVAHAGLRHIARLGKAAPTLETLNSADKHVCRVFSDASLETNPKA